MTLFRNAGIAAVMTLLMAAVCNCQKPDEGQDGTGSEAKTNYFTYEGFSFDICSVVKYDQGDNSVELWLSPKAGATTIAEIEAEGDYVVLCTTKSHLGKRDRFSEGTSKNSYIQFGAGYKFKYGDTGTAFIEASIEGDELTLEFLAQKLYTKANDIKPAIRGTYKGVFTAQTEQPYDNEWGINRNREALVGATYTTYEDGTDSSISLHTASTDEAIKLIIEPSMINKTISLPTASGSKIKLTYNGAVDFNLTKATGLISTSVINGELQVNIDATSNEKRFRANYNGSYEENKVKLNRYIFNYEGTSFYVKNGTYEIVKLMVEYSPSVCKFFLSPSEGYDISGSTSTLMPIITVPSDIINKGRKFFTDLTDWKFEFVEMQVWPYDNEYKPHPAETDWIEVSKNGDTYEVDFELSSIATNMPRGYIDAHYKGEAK